MFPLETPPNLFFLLSKRVIKPCFCACVGRGGGFKTLVGLAKAPSRSGDDRCFRHRHSYPEYTTLAIYHTTHFFSFSWRVAFKYIPTTRSSRIAELVRRIPRSKIKLDYSRNVPFTSMHFLISIGNPTLVCVCKMLTHSKARVVFIYYFLLPLHFPPLCLPFSLPLSFFFRSSYIPP